MDKIEKLVSMALKDISSDNFDPDFVSGCLAEALARLQGDWGSFDQVEE